MADRMTEWQIAEFKEAFDVLGQETISMQALRTLLRSLGYSPSEMELQDIVNEVDPDGYDRIDFHDFLCLMVGQRKNDNEQLIQQFKIFDPDNTGLVSLAELRHVIASMGHQLTDEEVEELNREANPNSNGEMHYQDFVFRMM